MVLVIKSGHDSKGLYISVCQYDSGRSLDSFFTMDHDGVLPTSYSAIDKLYIVGIDEIL